MSRLPSANLLFTDLATTSPEGYNNLKRYNAVQQNSSSTIFSQTTSLTYALKVLLLKLQLDMLCLKESTDTTDTYSFYTGLAREIDWSKFHVFVSY